MLASIRPSGLPRFIQYGKMYRAAAIPWTVSQVRDRDWHVLRDHYIYYAQFVWFGSGQTGVAVDDDGSLGDGPLLRGRTRRRDCGNLSVTPFYQMDFSCRVYRTTIYRCQEKGLLRRLNL